MATDWEPYAEHMLEVMSSIDGYKNLSESNDYVPRPASRPVTKFEQRGHRLGHGVWDLMFEGEIMAKNRSRRLRKNAHRRIPGIRIFGGMAIPGRYIGRTD